MTQNLLGAQASPYLRQHKDNPVHWMPWGHEALALAQQQNKPILLSIGYAACHWCHVMAHESFEDQATAEVMNALFINIKVDREERPDIDDIYMGALHMMGVQGGWPLTMFLTPQGEPFWGGTYFPKTARAGMPAFTSVCEEISRLFHEESDKVRANAEQLTQAARQQSEMNARANTNPEFVHQGAQALFNHMDLENGGMQGAPKFPQPFVFQYIWESGYLKNADPLKQASHLAASKIGAGGIYDHLGGGFARYSVDEKWLVPHFEKMLYDNALLIDLYTTLWKENNKPLYRNRVGKTIDWLTREMRLPGGGFAASLDADTEGEEGKFYVWSHQEVLELLGTQAQSFMDYYDISITGNFEGTNVINSLATQNDEADAHFEAACNTLFAYRAKRITPDLDDKVLTDWNGLMIGALARAAIVFGRPDWHALAQDAYAFIMTHMTQQKEGHRRLIHVWCKNVLGPHDTAEDYANMIDAALALYSASGEPSYLEDARSLTATLEDLFGVEDKGGYYMTARDAEAILVRPRHARDSALPNANGTMIWALSRLGALTGDVSYTQKADSLSESFWLHLEKEFPQMTSSMSSFLKHHAIVSCVITGRKDCPQTKALLQAAILHPRPGLVIQPAWETNLDPSHPAFEQISIKQNETPSAYLCLKNKCLAPIETAQVLTETLGVI